MSKAKLISALVVTGMVAPLIGSQTVFAWHPVGVITKQVQNQTTKGELQDANDSTHAVEAKTGDVLKYVITVRNDGAADSQGKNDLAKVKLTDTLPAGVALVDTPDIRTITADLGTIKPGAKVEKTYLVKVTETTNQKVVENKACFTGNSTINDNPQSGCDVADIKTNIPQVLPPAVTTTPSPAPTPAPTPPAQPQVLGAGATTLPSTGISGVISSALAAAGIGYMAAYAFLAKRKRALL